MRLINRWRELSLLALVVTVLCVPAEGQEISAGIIGSVKDPSGSAIAGASVTAKDQDRGTVWPTVTNGEGIYALPRIPAGNYELRVEAKGFRAAVQRDIQLEINQRLRLDIGLEIGAVSQTPEVTGSAPNANVNAATFGEIISALSERNIQLALKFYF